MKARKKYGARTKTSPTRRWLPEAEYRDELRIGMRRLRQRAVLVGLMSIEDFEQGYAEAWTLPQLFARARQRAREHALLCSKCGELIDAEAAVTAIESAENPLIEEVAATTTEAAVTGIETAENPKPFTA
jgi:hypothetical protein